jgi:hypothetical protein
MAGSRNRSTMGTDPWVASSRTCGPLGTNNDAADPATPDWFLGDTPGPLGNNDQADPDVRALARRYRFEEVPLKSEQPVSVPQCDSDWRFGATARMMLGGVWVAMDKHAWQIFDLWFNGNAPAEVTFDSEEWASYMNASDGLQQQIHAQLTVHAQQLRNRLSRGPDRLREPFHLTFHAEAGSADGGYTTGYDVLHGSNRTVGDFEIRGRFTAIRSGLPVPTYTITYDQVSFVFNDIVDINRKYKSDISFGRVAANMARCLNVGPPKDYTLHIKWTAEKPVTMELGP